MDSHSLYKRLNLKIRKINHARIDFGKMLLLRATILLARHLVRFVQSHASESDVQNSEFKYILIRLDGKLGDAVVSTGLIQLLTQAAKESGQKLLIIGDPVIQMLIEESNQVIIWPYKKGLFRLIDYSWKLRKVSVQAIINTSYILKPSHIILGLFAQAKTKGSFPFINAHIPEVWQELPATLLNQHISVLYSRLSQFAQLPEIKEYYYQLPYTKPARREGLCIGIWGAAVSRSFSLEALRWLIQQNVDSFHRIGFIATGKQRDFLEKSLKSTQLPSIDLNIEICPHNDLKSILAWINTFEKVISPDTAWVHVACALEIPVDAYYIYHNETSNINQWRPLSKAVWRQFVIPVQSLDELANGIQPSHLSRAKIFQSSS